MYRVPSACTRARHARLAYRESMNRKTLDALAAHHGLSGEAAGRMLGLANAQPGRADVERFLVRVLHLAGVLSLAAGVVFLVAANWSSLPIFGRFALVQAVLAGVVAIAVWRPPPAPLGRFALLLAFVVTGALLALFGQTYQTGADVYELFLRWALLGLPFAVAARWSVVWAAWTLVLNVALWLFCGARPEAGVFWWVVSPWTVSTSQLLIVPLVLNALLWALGIVLRDRGAASVAPIWLGRFALACAVASGTWSGMIVLIDGVADAGAAGLVVSLLVFLGVAIVTLRRRDDVFPLAAIEGSVLLLSTVWIARIGDFDGIGMFFVLSIWLIVVSTVSGRYLMRLVRLWDEEDDPASALGGETEAVS
jgi:hypothetical protein